MVISRPLPESNSHNHQEIIRISVEWIDFLPINTERHLVYVSSLIWFFILNGLMLATIVSACVFLYKRGKYIHITPQLTR